VKVIALGTLAVAVVAPYARRDDGVGWFAFSIFVAGALAIWTVCARGIVLNAIRWWRSRSASN
jgi:hypothetical protein